ncbi:hypothetical protein IOK49_06630 [Fervidicoccus fontis]|nr:hypothetical protein [Fervidicoccus fontis]MBE9391738.1 hypothetical protein [Fervidicoccus fontis]
MQMQTREGIQCPKCKTIMEYSIETEKFTDGTKRIKSFYKCPVCNYKVNDQQISVSKVDGTEKLIIKIEKFF